MKRTILFTLFIATATMLFTTSLGTLTGVYKPQLIKVQGKEIFIVENHTIFIYSSKDLHPITRIHREGNGPGEFSLDRNRTAAISVFPDYIVAESRYKIVYFTRKGAYIKERKKRPGIVQVVPIGKNFIVHKILYGPENKNYFTLNIADSELNQVKELYRQKFFTYGGKTLVVGDGINFCVADNKIFVEESARGFVIEIFDFTGNRLNKIEKDFEKIAVNATLREEALNHFLSVPALHQAVKQQGRQAVINDLRSRGGLSYPDYLPPIRDIKTDGKRIYVRTVYEKDNKEKYLILDTEGNRLKEAYLPKVHRESFFNLLQGDKKLYAFADNNFYYLKYQANEEEEDEEWQVHRVKID